MHARMRRLPARRRECTRDHRSPDEGRNWRRAVAISRNQPQSGPTANQSQFEQSTAINSHQQQTIGNDSHQEQSVVITSSRCDTTGPWSTDTSRFASAAVGRYLATSCPKMIASTITAGAAKGEAARIATSAASSAATHVKACASIAGSAASSASRSREKRLSNLQSDSTQALHRDLSDSTQKPCLHRPRSVLSRYSRGVIKG